VPSTTFCSRVSGLRCFGTLEIIAIVGELVFLRALPVPAPLTRIPQPVPKVIGVDSPRCRRSCPSTDDCDVVHPARRDELQPHRFWIDKQRDSFVRMAVDFEVRRGEEKRRLHSLNQFPTTQALPFGVIARN
jgi:hypothetical protein